MAEDQTFTDYYDILQVSSNADTDTIRRIFRHLAKKCHPDLPSGGNPEQFQRILKAHQVLTDPEKRAAYDLRYQEYWDRKWQILKQAGNGGLTGDNKEIRERILTVLYVQRRTDMRHPGLGDMELAQMIRMPVEFLDFDLWYLRNRGLVERLETGLLAISVDGVDHVEQSSLHLTPDRLLEAKNPSPEKTEPSGS